MADDGCPYLERCTSIDFPDESICYCASVDLIASLEAAGLCSNCAHPPACHVDDICPSPDLDPYTHTCPPVTAAT